MHGTERKEFKELTKKAKKGDAQSSYELSKRYYSGNGVDRDNNKALLWYEKYAECGNLSAQKNLGDYYLKVGENAKAVYWYEKAAVQGSATAQRNLGKLLLEGRGVKPHPITALSWYEKACEGGDVDALIELGDYFLKKENPDVARALGLYEKAAQKNLLKAQLFLAEAYYSGELNGVSVRKNSAKALFWNEKVAEKGHAEAQYRAGEMYFDGRGTQQNYSKAVVWFHKSAEQGYKSAILALFRCYSNGYGVAADANRANKFRKMLDRYKLTASERAEISKFSYGGGDKELAVKAQPAGKELAVENAKEQPAAVPEQPQAKEKKPDIAVKPAAKEKKADAAPKPAAKPAPKPAPKKPAEIKKVEAKKEEPVKEPKPLTEFEKLQLLAQRGNVDAQYALAYRCKYDFEKFGWWKKAAEQGHVEAQYNVAVCYYNGDGTVTNYSEAAYWFEKSADNGKIKALTGLGLCYIKKEDYEKAFRCFERAADEGDAEATGHLGYCYYRGFIEGFYLPRNPMKALELWRKAAEMGDESAREALLKYFGIC